jgi:hypothetical protein
MAKKQKRRVNLGWPSDSHLSVAQTRIKACGKALIAAKQALTNADCSKNVHFLAEASRHLGMVQAHLQSVNEQEPKAASQKIKLNRVFSVLKNEIGKALDKNRVRCVWEQR